MRSVFSPRVIIGLFILALCAPGIAVLFSPQFIPAMKQVVKSPSEWGNQRDGIRRTTPLWNKAVEGYSSFLYSLGTTNNKAIAVVGSDGWVFLGDVFNNNMAQALGRRYYNDNDINAWVSTVGGQQQWLATRNIPMLFLIAPAKWSIYPDKLPKWSQGHIGPHIFDQLLNTPQKLPLIDVRPALREARSIADTYSPFNSHWTDFGAWAAWRETSHSLAALNPKLQNLYIPEIDGADVNPNYGSEFAAMISLPKPNPWTLPKLKTALPDFLILGDDAVNRTVPGSTHTGLLELPRNTRNESANNKLKALILRDSMGDSLSPYIQAAFYETIQVRHNIDDQKNSPNVPALIDKYHPDVVLYVMTERHLDNILSEGYLWKSANAFDRAVADGVHVENIDGINGVAASGIGDLSAPARVSWVSDSKGQKTLKVMLAAKAPGALKVQAISEGNPVEFAERYAQGDNQLYFILPSTVDFNKVDLVSMDGSIQLMLGRSSIPAQDAK